MSNREDAPPGKMMAGHWGVFGGAFDPIHYGHLNLARRIQERTDLDGVLVIPSYRPPHRSEPEASFAHRIHMLTLGTANETDWLISTIETSLDGPGYAVDVVAALRQTYPGIELSFIIGADQVQYLTTWHDSERLFASVPFITGTRPGTDVENAIPPGCRLRYVDVGEVALSSTDIRSALRHQRWPEVLEGMIPPPVVAYILEHNLYSD